jgi:hypothetical protein
LEHRRQDGCGPEQALHSRQSTSRPRVDRGVVTPKTQLAALVRAHFFWYEGQFDDPYRCCSTSLGPALQLPAHSFTDAGRIESSVMAPTTAKRCPVLGLYFDSETSTDKASTTETAVQFLSQCFAYESSSMQPLGGWV